VCISRDSSELTAVCEYRVSDISALFSKGKYKNPLVVATSYVKWVMYTGDVPSPRPGAVSLPKPFLLSLSVCVRVRVCVCVCVKRVLFYK